MKKDNHRHSYGNGHGTIGRRAARREATEARNEARSLRSTQEQLDIIATRLGLSLRESFRLLGV